MSDRVRLLEETRRAYLRQVEARAELRGQDDWPEPGDVFAVEHTAGFSVEWAILARGGAGNQLLFAVPADAGTFVGSSDVEIADSAPSGPLTLRCRLGGWVDVDHFAPRVRTGVLDGDDVARAWDLCSQIAGGAVIGSADEREVDEDPDYQDWVDEVVAPARRALFGKAEDSAGGGREATASPAERPPSSEPRDPSGSRQWALLAASILLLVTGAFAGSLLWRQSREIHSLVREGEAASREHGREVERLEAERQRLKTEHGRDLAKAMAERAGIEQEYRERIAELDRRLGEVRRESDVVNPVIAVLAFPGDLRGEVKDLSIPRAASHLVLFLPLRGHQPAPKYRVELLEKRSGKRIWANSELTRQKQEEIRTGLPASLLVPGEYRLRLLGLEDGQSHPLREHLLRVRNESSHHGS